jgi:hypothetical protein
MLPSDQVNRNYVWESSAEYNAWKVEQEKWKDEVEKNKCNDLQKND